MKTVIGLFLLIVFLGGWSWPEQLYVIRKPEFQASKYPCKSTPPPETGEIEIESVPSGAEFFIDHIYAGKTPSCVSGLLEGNHLLRINLGINYLPYLANLDIRAGATVKINAALEKKAEIWFKEGAVAMKANQTQEAISDFLKAASGKPKINPKAYFFLGVLYAKENNPASAAKAFQRFAFYHSDSPVVYQELGKAYEQQHLLKNAVTSYKLAVLALPVFKGILSSAPAATWQNIAALKKKLAFDPEDMSNHVLLAYLYEQKGAFQQSISLLRAVLNQYRDLVAQERLILERI